MRIELWSILSIGVGTANLDYYPVLSLGSVNRLLHTLTVFSGRGDYPHLSPDQFSPRSDRSRGQLQLENLPRKLARIRLETLLLDPSKGYGAGWWRSRVSGEDGIVNRGKLRRSSGLPPVRTDPMQRASPCAKI